LDAAERSLTLAMKYADAGVVGLGLAGDEAGHPAKLFAEVFARAREAGLRAVPHGGEGAGPESVRACVEQLGASRVNHGIRAVEDPAVIDLLVERGVCLDVCPTSNVALHVSPSLEAHPLPVLVDSGVRVTLNSDCPLFVRTSVNDEYRTAHARMGLDLENLVEIAWTSLMVSSCPANRRDAALERISVWAASMGAGPLAGYASGP
jgi:adenosine deaminase